MASILSSLLDLLPKTPTVYSHRHRTIALIAEERGLDIEEIREELRTVLAAEGRVKATTHLRKRFRVPLHVAWAFVDRLDESSSDP